MGAATEDVALYLRGVLGAEVTVEREVVGEELGVDFGWEVFMRTLSARPRWFRDIRVVLNRLVLACGSNVMWCWVFRDCSSLRSRVSLVLLLWTRSLYGMCGFWQGR